MNFIMKLRLPRVKGKRGEYQKLSPKNKAIIGKYVSEHDVVSAVREFKDKKFKGEWCEGLAKFMLQKSKGEA